MKYQRHSGIKSEKTLKYKKKKKNSAQSSNKNIKGKMNQKKTIKGQQILNQHLIEISVGVNLMVIDCCFMNTSK